MKRSAYLLTILWVLTLLSACVTGAPATDSSATAEPVAESGCAEGFRLFVHSAGESCVPENPQRIVTTQDQNALLPLLELAIKPVGSAGQPLEDGGFRFRRVEGFDTEGIEFVGSYGEPNLESIALLQPDLIIGSPFQSDIYDSLSAIAPTVLIDVHNRPLDEALLDFAMLVNAEEQATALKADYEANVAEFLAALGDRREQITISVITPGWESGQFYNEATGQATGTVMQALGLLRPAPEAGPDAITDLRSVETLPEHDADVMIIISYTGEDQDPLFDEFFNSPILNNLRVAEAEQIYVFDGLRTVGAGWGKMNSFIDELERVLLNPDLNIDVVQEPAAQASTTAQDSDATCADGERLFADANIVEPVCVPVTAQRIITLDPFYSLQMGVQLGIPIIASATVDGSDTFPASLTPEETAGITAVGAFDTPNLELLAGLNADLIIGDAYFYAEQVDLLNQIAPTVLINTPEWKQWIYTIAAAAGVPERAEDGFAEYEARIAAIQPRLRDVEVSFVRLIPGGFQVYLDGPSAYAPFSVLAEAGVKRTAFETTEDDTVLLRPDFETLPNLTGDILFYVVGGANDPVADNALVEEVTANPIWQQLPAVQAGEVYRLENTHWMGFGGLRSAHAILDDIEMYLAD